MPVQHGKLTSIDAGMGWEPLWAPVLAYAAVVGVQITQITEMFGRLRFRFAPEDYPIPDVLSRAIDLAQEASEKFCHICGEPGRRREGAGGLQLPPMCSLHWKEQANGVDASAIADAIDAEVVSAVAGATSWRGNAGPV